MKRNIVILLIVSLILSACGKEPIDDTSTVESNNEVSESIDKNTEEAEVNEEKSESEKNEPEESVETADNQNSSGDEVNEVEEVIDYNEVGVNEVGHIMVVMYHGIKDNPPYHITKEAFLNDLTYMYENNYRLISMSDYLDQTIDIEAGMTPIVFTFDDALSSTFSLEEVDGQLQVKKDTAIGILEQFCEEHPDFGKNASLYIHDTVEDFEGAGTVKERIQWLIDHGYEIGNHSATHANFGKLSKNQLIEEIGRVEVFMINQGFDYNMRAITYPFGKRPSSDLMSYIKEGDYNEVHYNYEVAFREGPSAVLYAPCDVRFDPYNAPRVRGSSGDIQDMWWFIDYYDQSNPSLKYVSDGDPNTIVVPENLEEKVNRDKYPNQEVITYTKN